MEGNYVCNACGWVYMPDRGDAEGGVPKNTPFDELPEDWTCPFCGVGIEMFEEEI